MSYNVKRGKLSSRKAELERKHPYMEVMIAGQPIAIISEGPNDADTIVRLYGRKGVSDADLPGYFATIIADLVRHAANACKVPEATMWKLIDAERRNPTGISTALPLDYTELQGTPTEGGKH
jgi:hypothetical protein